MARGEELDATPYLATKGKREKNEISSDFQESLDECLQRLNQMTGTDCPTLEEAILKRAREDPVVRANFEQEAKDREKRCQIAANLKKKKEEWTPQALAPGCWPKKFISLLQFGPQHTLAPQIL